VATTNNSESLGLLELFRKEEQQRHEVIEHGRPTHTTTIPTSTESGSLKAARLRDNPTRELHIPTAETGVSIDLNLDDFDRQSALHLAVTRRHSDILRLLGASPTINNIILDKVKLRPFCTTQ